jgi:hypothetical protein
MVGAFMEMANSDHTDQKKMAQTLSHGLVVTMLGIGLAERDFASQIAIGVSDRGAQELALPCREGHRFRLVASLRP